MAGQKNLMKRNEPKSDGAERDGARKLSGGGG